MRRIALVGTSETGAKAPFADPSWEIWGVSSRMYYVTRADRWFEIHRLDGEPAEWAKGWRNHVRTTIGDTPLYMIYPEPGLVPNVVQYPTDRIAARFGTYFMTSTFSWMMALAIDELRPLSGDAVDGELAVYGVDMEYGTEYVQQRAGFRHFMALAKELRIPLTRLASSGLSYEPVPYPMWQDDPLLNKLDLRIAESNAKLKIFDETIRRTRNLITANEARVEELNLAVQEGYNPEERFAQLQKEHTALVESSAAISKDIVHWQAVREEQGWLKDYLQP